MLRQYGKEAGSSELQDTWRKAGLSILSYVPEVRPGQHVLCIALRVVMPRYYSDIASYYSDVTTTVTLQAYTVFAEG